MIGRIITGWQLVVKRSLVHWRLMTSVVLGVLLASAIMAGTVIYFDALRELALKNALGQYTKLQLHVLVEGRRGPSSYEEAEKVSSFVNGEVNKGVAWMLRDRIRATRSPTFFLTTPGNEQQAGHDDDRAYFTFLPRLQQQTTLISGRLPRMQHEIPEQGPLEVEAIVPLDAAQLFGIEVGDRLVAVLPWDDRFPYVTVVVTGVFEKDDPNDEFWYLERKVLREVTGPKFRTVPFHLPEETYMGALGWSLRRMDTTYAWLLVVDTDRLNARNAADALAGIDAMKATLGPALFGYRQRTSLDDAIREYDQRLFFSKLPIVVVLIVVAVVALYYVAALSSLVVEERRGEVALLRSRGASNAQILTVFVLEGATIAAVAAVAGPLLAAGTISILGYTPAFSDLSGGDRLAVSVTSGAYMMSVLGGVLSFGALMVPAVQASRIGVTRQRQQAARPTRLPAFQRYYLDVMLLLFSIFLFRQLTEHGSVVATSLFGDLEVNQLLLALPGLILVASAMVLLRLFPLAMNLASRVLGSRLPAGLVMGVWQMARNPTHYARLSLLLILTAGLGIFASSFGGTLERSFEERVLYSTGSDVRVDGILPLVRTRRALSSGRALPDLRADLEETYNQLPGVERAAPVLRSSGQDLTRSAGVTYDMVAVDGESFSKVAWFREDFSGKPIKSLLGSLGTHDSFKGIELPSDALAIGVRVKADRPHPTIRLTARIRDEQDRYSTLDLGRLHSGDWIMLGSSLEFGNRRTRTSSLPVTLVSLRVDETVGGRDLQGGSILFNEIWVRKKTGGIEVVEPFEDAENWSVLKVTAGAVTDELHAIDIGYSDQSRSVLFSWSQGPPLTPRGIFHGTSRSPLPVLASKGFVRATGHSIGEEFEVSVAGHRVPVGLLEVIDFFPTMTTPNQRFLVADLASLIRYANLGAIVRELRPNEVWLSTSTAGLERERLLQSLEEVEVYSVGNIRDRREMLAKYQIDPLVNAGWKSLLFIAFSAVLILSILGFLVHAYVSFQNRQVQFALLRTLGFSMRQLITMVWLEQAFVVGVGLVLGTWVGGRLGATIMPYLGHDDRGVQVTPPFMMEINWGTLLTVYAIMILAFGIITLGSMWLIQRISLQRILRLGEM